MQVIAALLRLKALWTRKPPAAMDDSDDKLLVQNRSGQGVPIKGELWNIMH